MKIEFVYHTDGELLYRRDNVQYIPSLGEELCLPSGEYKVVERTFHYHDGCDDCVLIWLKSL